MSKQLQVVPLEDIYEPPPLWWRFVHNVRCWCAWLAAQPDLIVLLLLVLLQFTIMGIFLGLTFTYAASWALVEHIIWALSTCFMTVFFAAFQCQLVLLFTKSDTAQCFFIITHFLLILAFVPTVCISLVANAV